MHYNTVVTWEEIRLILQNDQVGSVIRLNKQRVSADGDYHVPGPNINQLNSPLSSSETNPITAKFCTFI